MYVVYVRIEFLFVEQKDLLDDQKLPSDESLMEFNRSKERWSGMEIGYKKELLL